MPSEVWIITDRYRWIAGPEGKVNHRLWINLRTAEEIWKPVVAVVLTRGEVTEYLMTEELSIAEELGGKGNLTRFQEDIE